MRLFNDLKLLAKLAIPTLVVIAVMAGFTWHAKESLDDIVEQAHALIDVTAGRRAAALRIASNVAEIAVQERNIIIDSDVERMARYKQRYDGLKAEVLAATERAVSLAATPEQRALAEEQKRDVSGYFAAAEKSIAFGLKNENESASGIMLGEGRAARTKLRESVDRNVQLAERELDAAKARMRDSAHATTTALIEMGVAGLLLTVGLLGAIAILGIARPMGVMTADMGKLAAGDFKVDVKGVARKDEIGALARALQVFKENGLEMRRLETEAEEQRGQSESERRRNEQERARLAREQEGVVHALASGLEQLSGGNLTYRIDEAFAPEYRKLRDDFNAAMGQLQETIKVIATSTHGIRSGSGEISHAADDLSRRTEQQAASLEETAAALDQITATVRKTADGARLARQAVTDTQADAAQSSRVVGEAVDAMSGIEKSAQEISQIIGVIDEIAFQTNLLALNAGVEAARAGEAGRGFAVVASEVRALAQRSAEAAKEIKTLISTSSAQVDRGVSLVGQTGQALERIVAQVAQIDGVVSEIAASAQEQASGLSQVNVAINQMDQVTQQNAAMVEQSTAASHGLAQEAGQLAHLVAHFKVVAQELRAVAAPQRQAA